MESQREFGPFVIDFQERTLRRGGQPVALTPKAFDVLAALLEQPGRLFTKQELLDKVWPDTFVEESNLTYNVFSLRKALGDPAENGQYIETVPRRGYRFTGALTSLSVNHGNPQLAGAGGGLNAASAVEPHRFQPVDPPVAIADPAAGSTGPVQTPAPARSRWRPSRSVLAMSVSVAIAASLLVYWWTESTTSEPLRAIPLTSMPGVVRSPSLSPDGTHVVFTWTGTRQDNRISMFNR